MDRAWAAGHDLSTTRHGPLSTLDTLNKSRQFLSKKNKSRQWDTSVTNAKNMEQILSIVKEEKSINI